MDNSSLNCLNLQILRASHLILKTYEEGYRPHGIGATQVPVLQLIANKGPVSIKLIAEQTIIDRSVLSRKLQLMEKNLWIEKQRVAGTQERQYIISKAGAELLKQLQPTRAHVQDKLLHNLSSKEQRDLVQLCNKLVGNDTHKTGDPS
jgi:DNA-binding MarR family transcriptional regulator